MCNDVYLLGKKTGKKSGITGREGRITGEEEDVEGYSRNRV